MVKKREMIYLEVTIKRIYGFEDKAINGWSPDKVIDDWFKSYNINLPHAARDGNHFGNIDTIESVNIVLPGDFEPRVKKYFSELHEAQEVKDAIRNRR